MDDYRKMYLRLFRGVEDAINTLIAAQRDCEELFVCQPETDSGDAQTGRRGEQWDALSGETREP